MTTSPPATVDNTAFPSTDGRTRDPHARPSGRGGRRKTAATAAASDLRPGDRESHLHRRIDRQHDSGVRRSVGPAGARDVSRKSAAIADAATTTESRRRLDQRGEVVRTEDRMAGRVSERERAGALPGRWQLLRRGIVCRAGDEPCCGPRPAAAAERSARLPQSPSPLRQPPPPPPC